MRLILATLLIFVSCVVIFAQDTKENEIKSELKILGYSQISSQCGDHLLPSEGNIYPDSNGKIIQIVDGNTVIFESVAENGEKEKMTFNIAGVKNSNSAKVFLEKKLLNKSVRVMGWFFREKGKDRVAVIYAETAELDEVGCFMIKNGIARHKKFEGNDIVPDYKNYYYNEAEEKAKEEKLGIWAK